MDHEFPNLRSLTPVYFALHLVGGHIGLPFLVCTFLVSKSIHRHPTIINFCITWIIYSIIYCLLVYGGNNYHPTAWGKLCLTQASMIYGAPPMAVVAGLEVVMEVWFTVYTTWRWPWFSGLPPMVQVALVVSPPYFVFLAFSIFAAVLASANPASVSADNGIYCSIQVDHIGRFVVPAFCGTVLMVILSFEVTIILGLYRDRRRLHELCPLAETKGLSISPWLRAAIFLLYSWTTLGACISYLTNVVNPFPYMSQAACTWQSGLQRCCSHLNASLTVPFGALLVFGIQKDVIGIWCSWMQSDPECIPKRVQSTASPNIALPSSRMHQPSPASSSSDITDMETHIAAVA
ncbi:hypothetical protein B0H21DRAFT_760604 [Amylocystis lapponica]|nr:hypothetical protein B0H21DRAFT_760604 [Amylocystis lapponica]